MPLADPRRPAVAWLVFCLGPVALAQPLPSLREAYRDRFDIGTALSARQLLTPEPEVLGLVARQFSAVTPENVMKWQAIHPEPGRYDFRAADALVRYAEAHGLKVIGHTLVWHRQCPGWVFEDARGGPVSRGTLIERMRDHIHTVVGRYRGRVHGWDVVNEAILDDGSLRDSEWRRIVGDDYLELAFRFAHEADPDTRLHYNDFSMTTPGKRRATAELVRRLRAAGVPIHAIGLQGHWGLDQPGLEEIDAALTGYAALGVEVMITELDVDVLPRPGAEHAAGLDPYRDGLPAEVQQQQARRYADLFRVFVRHSDAISRVTFWGVDDGQSWHNHWPVPGRTAHSLLFDRWLQPKPAFWGVATKQVQEL